MSLNLQEPIPSPFSFCPACGKPGGEFLRGHEFRCPHCGHRYFHNVAVGAGAILTHRGKFLFARRAMDPQKGFLGIPGGFVDPGESSEEAVARECREELGAEITNLRFIASFPNRYGFKDIWYNVCDFYFEADLVTDPAHLRPDPHEVMELVWLPLDEVKDEDLSFPSLKRLVALLKKGRN